MIGVCFGCPKVTSILNCYIEEEKRKTKEWKEGKKPSNRIRSLKARIHCYLFMSPTRTSFSNVDVFSATPTRRVICMHRTRCLVIKSIEEINSIWNVLDIDQTKSIRILFTPKIFGVEKFHETPICEIVILIRLILVQIIQIDKHDRKRKITGKRLRQAINKKDCSISNNAFEICSTFDLFPTVSDTYKLSYGIHKRENKKLMSRSQYDERTTPEINRGKRAARRIYKNEDMTTRKMQKTAKQERGGN
ncbi:hypothetical protein DICVIV_07096 [Dictyocaulus viviparus]|uniref:Uncharacterized protein n=1 Tax=Dictyocaulus viviparus TaxID=29172 RepID=A0A0D8XWU7_DICVI|nr:hypothetical protein DICVIV_07096 [Dictyocaulus viviparus]